MTAPKDCTVCGRSFTPPHHNTQMCSETCKERRRETYNIWYQMRQRCFNEESPSFENYGAEGISVCERWDDFWAFVEDMGWRPADRQLDRIDSDGDYSPDNCRWVTRSENMNNRRNTKYLTYQGRTRPLAEWARERGLTPKQLNARLYAGWSVGDAISTPLARKP